MQPSQNCATANSDKRSYAHGGDSQQFDCEPPPSVPKWTAAVPSLFGAAAQFIWRTCPTGWLYVAGGLSEPEVAYQRGITPPSLCA